MIGILMFEGAKGNRVRMEIQHKSKSVLPANLITGTGFRELEKSGLKLFLELGPVPPSGRQT